MYGKVKFMQKPFSYLFIYQLRTNLYIIINGIFWKNVFYFSCVNFLHENVQ